MGTHVTLAIHTASSINTVAVIKGKQVFDIQWMGSKDESEKLLPMIEKMLKKAASTLKDIDRIVVVKGPGPFSALRIGVTVANILAMSLGVELYSVDAVDVWRARLGKDNKDAILLLFAGGSFVAHNRGVNKKIAVENLESVLRKYALDKRKTLVFFGDLSENGHTQFNLVKKPTWTWLTEKDLTPFGQVILEAKRSILMHENPVTPLYFNPPNITPSVKK